MTIMQLAYTPPKKKKSITREVGNTVYLKFGVGGGRGGGGNTVYLKFGVGGGRGGVNKLWSM